LYGFLEILEEMSSKENVYRRISRFGKLLAECQTQVSLFILPINLGKRLKITQRAVINIVSNARSNCRIHR